MFFFGIFSSSTFLPAYWLIAIFGCAKMLILKPSKSKKAFLKESQRKTNPYICHTAFLVRPAGIIMFLIHRSIANTEASTLKIPSGPGRVLKNQIRYGRRGIFLMSREPVEMVEPFFRWWFQRFLIFIHTWGNDPIWLSYFSKGLKPPTRFDFPKHLSLAKPWWNAAANKSSLPVPQITPNSVDGRDPAPVDTSLTKIPTRTGFLPSKLLHHV